jgi:hypothetical protein
MPLLTRQHHLVIMIVYYKDCSPHDDGVHNWYFRRHPPRLWLLHQRRRRRRRRWINVRIRVLVVSSNPHTVLTIVAQLASLQSWRTFIIWIVIIYCQMTEWEVRRKAVVMMIVIVVNIIIVERSETVVSYIVSSLSPSSVSETVEFPQILSILLIVVYLST